MLCGGITVPLFVGVPPQSSFHPRMNWTPSLPHVPSSRNSIHFLTSSVMWPPFPGGALFGTNPVACLFCSFIGNIVEMSFCGGNNVTSSSAVPAYQLALGGQGGGACVSVCVCVCLCSGVCWFVGLLISRSCSSPFLVPSFLDASSRVSLQWALLIATPPILHGTSQVVRYSQHSPPTSLPRFSKGMVWYCPAMEDMRCRFQANQILFTRLFSPVVAWQQVCWGREGEAGGGRVFVNFVDSRAFTFIFDVQVEPCSWRVHSP